MKTNNQASLLSAKSITELSRKGVANQLSTKLLLTILAQIKNGAADIYLLRDLLRPALLPQTYPSLHTERWKETVRLRAILLGYNTQLRKKAYHIIFKNNLRPPGFDALSGIGRRWLFSQRFGEYDLYNLKWSIALFDAIGLLLREVDQKVGPRIPNRSHTSPFTLSWYKKRRRYNSHPRNIFLRTLLALFGK